MASFNKVILLGNLTRDPQVRYIPSGMAVADIGLAVNHTWFDKQSQQKREEVTFVDVVLWGRQAEVAGEYLAKGRSVLIEGRLKLETWQDKESGQNRSKMKVVCESMTMVGGRPDGQSGGGGGGGARGRSGGAAPQGEPSGGYQGEPSGGGHQGEAGDDSGGYGSGDAYQDSGPPDDEVPF